MPRGKEKLEQLPCEQFLQAFEIYRALLRAKQVGEKRAKIQNPVKIAHKAVFLFLSSTVDAKMLLSTATEKINSSNTAAVLLTAVILTLLSFKILLNIFSILVDFKLLKCVLMIVLYSI